VSDTPRLLGGRYEVGQLLGRGGMAEVHVGRDTRLGRSVAIKMLRADLARDPQFHKRFRREAQAAASLNHPAIVAVYDSGEDIVTEAGGATIQAPYIVMEYVEGRTVRDLLAGSGPLDWQEALRITSGVLAALEYSHRAGIVHRDIKPANVMLTPTGAIKVMDFGIARALADSSATMTQTQAVIGTAQYLSPEQAKGQQVDARSDLYSTGCLLFELLTGRPPFVGDSPVSVAYQHVGEMPPTPGSLVAGSPPDVDSIVMHALAKDREARYQDAASMRADAEAVLAGRPISAEARGAAGVPAGPVPGLGAEAAAAAAAMATQAMPYAAEATQAMPTMPAPTELVPGGLGGLGASTFADGTGVGGPSHLEEPESKKPNRAPAYVLLALAAIAAVVLLLVFGPNLFGGKDTPQVTVPPLTQSTQAEATASLAKLGLKAVVTQAPNADAATKGQVTAQDPVAGTKVKPGASVTITVSTGPDTVRVPDVSGMSKDDATAALKDVGLTVSTTDTVESAAQDAGKVISSDPAANKTVNKGDSVALHLASGKATVPNVVGSDNVTAVNKLTAAGFKVKQVPVNSDQPINQVVAQDHAGDVLKRGQTVTLQISNGTPTSTPTDTGTGGPTDTPTG
jgi:beta-lactam-binding protein with PASTA domain/tRNA A-37 threonylcarbamoyl transferase component Bud32